MTAILKTIPVKKAAFVIPTISEIAAYMRIKTKWPDKFIEYYAEKFWCYYQSNGWKVSGKAAMKDWNAAFTAQWKQPKFKEDIDFLNECLKTRPVEKQNKSYLNDLLAAYKKQFDSVPHEALVAAYDFLKAEKRIKLTPEESSLLRKTYGDNVEKGKAACVTIIFSKMITNGLTF